MPHNLPLDDRPDEHQVVIEAVEVAVERGLPLTAELVENVPATRNASGNASRKDTLPRKTPWSELPADAVEEVQRVDIVRSLSAISPRMASVEAEIERLITTPIKLIADIASHTLNAGGKRLRPALTLIAAQLCGDNGETPASRVVTCAAAIELTHTTTLLHDDVVDQADMRRGKPTGRLLWGNEASVLVGDYLFAQVFVTAAQKGFSELVQPLATATAQMCAGELLETQTRGYLRMSEKQYREIISLKTASLTECACRLGAIAMEADEDQVRRLAQFGHDIGMAFQIVDDVFDIIATEGRLGKPVGNDIRAGDITLPMLRAMQVCGQSDCDELERIIGATVTRNDPVPEEDVQRALGILRGCDAVEYSLQIARSYVMSAKSQLEPFTDDRARSILYDIADYVLSREK